MRRDKKKDFFEGFAMGACTVGAAALIALTVFWILL